MLLDELAADLATREREGLKRSRRIAESASGPRMQVEGRELRVFGSNDYLSLANHPRIVEAVRGAALEWGVGSGASHLLTGHYGPHEAAELELAEWVGMPRALGFSTGYMANLAVITALLSKDDAVFGDKLNHACLNDAALLSRAQFVRYAHGDVGALARALAQTSARRKLIATDAVFSMDGDLAPLADLMALAEVHDAFLLVDDAHGFGVLGNGRGALRELDLASPRLIYMGTLGKAAGVAGAFVAGEEAVIETLLQTARSYVFTTAAPALLSVAVSASLTVMRDEPWRREQLFANIARLKDGLAGSRWRMMPSNTAIQPVLVGENEVALALSRSLWDRGFWVPAIRPPTVPRGTARLRISLCAGHSEDDVAALVAALRAS